MNTVIIALLIGRDGSQGFPGKNIHPVLGKALMEYPLIAAREAKSIDRIYVSTDSENIREIGKKYGARIINRPAELCNNTALGENAFEHGYWEIKKELKQEGESVELMVLLMCNSPTILGETIDEGVRVLRANRAIDSAVTVSRYNMWSPLRARKIGADGLLHPFVPFEVFGDPKTLNCDRDSQGDVWFADMGVSIVKPHCLEHMEDGILPQKWMGQKIFPLKQWGGCDIDYYWQIPQVEYWIKEYRPGKKE